MSANAIIWALDDNPDVSGTQKLVLVILAESADDTGRALISRSDIARRASCSTRQVDRALSVLKKQTLITTHATYQWCDATNPACAGTQPHKHRSATTYKLHMTSSHLEEEQ